MKPGRRPDLPSTKVEKGTFQPCRDAGKQVLVEPNALPHQPDWLTTEGEEVWQDDLGRVSANMLATERDSTQFANYCNLQGAIIRAWRTGDVPPAAHMTEARRMAEQFGLFGVKSRLFQKGQGGEPTNPFARNGRRGS